MSNVFGFIGVGNMGGALARAVRRTLPGDCIMLADNGSGRAAALASELGARSLRGDTIARYASFVVIGVKPQSLPELFKQIGPVFSQRRGNFVLVSMAAGVSIERLRDLAGADYPVIRIMSNTPCAVGEGTVLYVCDGVAPEMETGFLEAMSGAGMLQNLPEAQFDAGTAISGCGPAYVSLFLEALADGGVACGLSRNTAMRLAAQTLAGTAKLLQSTGAHPGMVKDAVCSPGGATIQGVLTLEKAGFRGAVMDAALAAWEESQQLG